MQQTAFNFDCESGAIGAMSVETTVAALQAADAIGNAKRSAESCRSLLDKPALVPPVKRAIGKPALEKGHKDALRDLILMKSPSEFGLSYRTWSIQAIRDLILVKFAVSVSESSVRNYVKQWGMAAAAPLSRTALDQRTPLQQDWLVEQFSFIKSKAKAAKQRVVWLSAKQLKGMGGARTVVYAVSNANRKTSWLAINSENRMGSLNELFDALNEGGRKPLVLFDESIPNEFKKEIQAFLEVKHSKSSEKVRKNREEDSEQKKAFNWLKSIFNKKAKFWPVMVHDLGDESPACIADKIERNDRSWWYLIQHEDPNERIAKDLIEICSKDLVLNPVASAVFADAFGWMTDESEEERSFRWCAKVLGIDPDAYRVGLLIKISQTPMTRDTDGKKLAEKRRVALHFIPCYN